MGILLSVDDVMLSKGELEGLDEIAVLEKTAQMPHRSVGKNCSNAAFECWKKLLGRI